MGSLSEAPIRLLVCQGPGAKDSQNVVQLLAETPEIRVDHVESCAAAVDKVHQESFDCALVVEPLEDVLSETVAHLHSARKLLPLIVLGDGTGPRAAVAVMREGASDFLSLSELTLEPLLGAIDEAVHRSHLDHQMGAAGEAARVAEKVLRERELQIRGFFDFASAAMALIGPGGSIIRANPALRRLCGYELEEVGRLMVTELVTSDDRAQVSEGLALLMSREIDVVHDELQLRHKSGTPIWVDASIAVIADEDGEVQGYTFHATDIRNRKATEAELQRTERRFQELLAQAPIGIFETDVHGSCRYVNDRWSFAAGLSYSEAIGPGWMRTIHPDDRQEFKEEWFAAVRSGQEFKKVFRFQREDESVVWVSARAGATKDHAGAVLGYLGTVSDITDQYQAEQALRRTGALLQGVLDSAPYIVIVTNIDGIIREFNRGAERQLGYKAAEVKGEPALPLLHVADELEDYTRSLSKELEQPITVGMPVLAMESGGADHVTWTYVRKDGTHFPVELAVREMRDEDGRLYGYVAIGNDITDRVRRDQELLSAKDEAERASAAKADFLARMSHEIRTPMNSVLGMTEVALQTSLTAEQRGYLELVQGSGQTLLRLINDILDFSKSEAKRLTLDAVAFDLYETFAVSLRGLSHQAREKGVELVLRIDSDAPEQVLGDPHRIQQVLINLVGNAVKFTAEGEIVVDVACTPATEEGTLTLYLEVRDTGPGVAEEDQEKIFRAFTQEDTGIARRFGGTGLGLAICSQLVELMGGEIWLDSVPGQGSCFHVTLQLHAAEAAQLAPSVPDFAIRPRESVLVVEPNDKSREVTRSLLERWGYRSVCVSSPAEALDKVREMKREGGRFGIALLDLFYWDRRGQRFADALEKANGKLGFICLSPRDTGEEERWTESLVSLVKPILPGELRAALRDAQAPPSKRSTAMQGPVNIRTHADRTLRILVAEDNPTNQLVVSSMLTRLGHESEMVDNGQAALERLEEQDFDLVLMDMQMPVMGGLEATRSIRAREDGGAGRIPIVALTAQAMKGDREECLQAGMDDYLSKPLDMQSLARVLDAQLSSLSGAESIQSVEQFNLPPPSIAPVEARVDFESLRMRIGDNAVALAKISALFERDSGRLVSEIAAQVEARGPGRKSSAAHTLKGMLFNVCAPVAGELATSLEHSTQEGDWDEAASELERLQAEVRFVVLELQRESQASGAASLPQIDAMLKN